MAKHCFFGLIIFLFSYPVYLNAQSTPDTLPTAATLEQCIAYALKNFPQIEQAIIDEKITEQTIRSRLADWYPQVNFNYSLQHNFQVQTNIIGGNPVRLGVGNTSLAQFAVSQNIFNRDVLLAVRSKGDVQLQARQNTVNRKIDLVADVSKAFYDILATSQQIKVADQNILRLEKSLKDAFNQFKAGIADKTDYKRTTITLNNTRATRQTNIELLRSKREYLKFLMGYPETASVNIVYDSMRLENEIALDTLQFPDHTNRIEYRILETQKRLQEANYAYEKNSFLPSVSFNGAYNLNYLNNKFAKLYSNNYPASFAALTLGFPLYQGGRRKANINVAALELQRVDKDIENLRLSVNTEYANAMANYKGNYANYLALKENVELAQEVYNVIELQYKSGIKTYLEVIVSETELRNSQINYFNALYQLLASKIDVQKALGQISAN